MSEKRLFHITAINNDDETMYTSVDELKVADLMTLVNDKKLKSVSTAPCNCGEICTFPFEPPEPIIVAYNQLDYIDSLRLRRRCGY